ncbi:MAG: hypothetical protein BWY59_00523 [Verrucomicrobia bacterium ADurb.Bin345]|nr:MAG: hypothetical protein BWY59_00523 [Verrucomicrobia bacterium ADurb.Bin345]
MSAALAAFEPSAVKLAMESSRHWTMSAQSAPSTPYARYCSTKTMFVNEVNEVPHFAFAFVMVAYFCWHHVRNACSDCGS